MNTCYFDSETMGLYGPAVIFQCQFDYSNKRHDDQPFMYDLWNNPVSKTIDLIEEIVACRVVCHNITFDWTKLQQFFNAARALERTKGPNFRPITDVDLFAHTLYECRDIFCLKPPAAVCTLMLAQKELGGTSLATKEIRVKKLPKDIGQTVADILNKNTKLPAILFARRKSPERWLVAQSDHGDAWVDVALRFGPSNALKDIARFVLEVEDTQKLGQDIEMPEFPIEEGFAPYATLLDDGNWMYKGQQLWPLRLDAHLAFWTTKDSPQEKYALDDVILLKKLDEHFGKPDTDFDSEIGCQVASVRAAGFSIDTDKLATEIKSSAAIIESAQVNVDSPLQVRKYISDALDPMEAHVIADSCDKATLLKMTSAFVLDEAEECCNTGCDRCNGRKTVGPGPMPVVDRVEHILKVRKHRKRQQLYGKLEVAKGAFPSFRVIGTKSGRMSGADGLNYHGIDGSREIREVFTLGDGVLGTEVSGGDFDSQELAIAAAVMNDSNLADDIGKGKSLHGVFAASASGLPYEQIMAHKEDKATPEANWYKKAKICVYAILYGASAFNISFTLGVDPEEADRIILNFFEKYPYMAQTRKMVKESLECLSSDSDGRLQVLEPKQKYIESIFGFRRSFEVEYEVIDILFQSMNEIRELSKKWPGECIRKDEKGKQTYGGAASSALYGSIFSMQGKVLRAALNHLIQSAGRTVTLTVQKRIWDDIQPIGAKPFRVKLMSVHDEIATVQKRSVTPLVADAVRNSVADLCKTVPLLSLEWASNVGDWYGVKSADGERMGWGKQ
ncbi:MAG: hypothetical protein GY906_04785 [bacterium]|nr:hypothetical protein [bacterium]